MGPLGYIFRKYNIMYHLFVDDTQLYIPIDPNGSQSFDGLAQCLGEIRTLSEIRLSVLFLGRPLLPRKV